MTERKRLVVESEENGRGDRYDYDEEGQLKTASYQVENPFVGGSGAERADSFQYDELGNRMGSNRMASRRRGGQVPPLTLALWGQ